MIILFVCTFPELLVHQVNVLVHEIVSHTSIIVDCHDIINDENAGRRYETTIFSIISVYVFQEISVHDTNHHTVVFVGEAQVYLFNAGFAHALFFQS